MTGHIPGSMSNTFRDAFATWLGWLVPEGRELLFVLGDEANESYYQVASIHDERGYEKVRSALARSLDVSAYQPDIQVVDVDLLGDRCLR